VQLGQQEQGILIQMDREDRLVILDQLAIMVFEVNLSAFTAAFLNPNISNSFLLRSEKKLQNGLRLYMETERT